MRFAITWSSVGLLLSLGATAASGHDLWLEPSDFSPDPGQAVAVHLHLGHGNDDVEAIGRLDERLLKFSVTDPQGQEEEILGLPGRTPAGMLRPEAPGLQILGYHTSPLRHELSAESFRRVLEEEGLDAILESRARSGKADSPTSERYRRCLKALLAVGDAAAPGADRALGLPLELVAEFDPRASKPGSPLDLKLLYLGKPLPGARVVAHSISRPAQVAEVRSGADGEVRLKLPSPGSWRVHAVHMVEAPPDSGVEWESFWTALSFELDYSQDPEPNPYGYEEEARGNPRGPLNCFCSTDPDGKTFCGVIGSCKDKACTKNSDCLKTQRCLVNNCCPGAQGKGVCVDRCPGECLKKGPFSCFHFPQCVQL